MPAATTQPSETADAPSEPSKKTIGAVVVGGDYQGLGIVRSLGRRKIPVAVIDDERSIARFSKYTTYTVPVDSLREEKQTVERLLEIGRRLGLEGWVLYPTREETVAAFARHRPTLRGFFRVPTPDWNTTQWFWDKRNTYRRAKELGIPTPSTWYIRDVSELQKIDSDPPFVIKPAIKEHFIYSTKVKAWRANSRAELRELFLRAAQLVGPDEVMIQSLIPGGGSQQFAYGAFFKEGRALGSMVVRRARQHPPEFGRASTYVETIEIPLLEDLSERFLRAIDYYGLVELEYKFDPRDQLYKLLDVNGRTWGYHTLGFGAGVDFPLMLYADQVGEPVEPRRGRAGVKWIRLVTDVPTGILEILGGRQDWQLYLRSLLGFDVESVFSWEDPMPGLVELALIPYLAVKRGF
jgi:predicted ATP-grasp superfamily ATP-dependent carboligase